MLRDCALSLREQESGVLEANAKDLDALSANHPHFDRLRLTPDRLHAIADDIEAVAKLPSPLGLTLEHFQRPNGLSIRKVSVPFGLIAVIYEARPNVTLDVFALALKSGNAVVLKGSSAAKHSNLVLARIIRDTLSSHQLDRNLCTLLPPTRTSASALLNAVGLVDLLIPRGSADLIRFVRDNARVPVIETGAGVCHTYFDAHGDVQKGQAIILNAKTRRVSVCNALDCLIIHHDRLTDLPTLTLPLADHSVRIFADPPAFNALADFYPHNLLLSTNSDSFGTEFLDYKMSIRTVDTLDQALEHIARFGSKHSEAIISESPQAIDHFQRLVDAACVYANASTAFSDGAQFGFGAEIGISTQKLHARGPMALRELTSYKFLIDGHGHTRPS